MFMRMYIYIHIYIYIYAGIAFFWRDDFPHRAYVGNYLSDSHVGLGIFEIRFWDLGPSEGLGVRLRVCKFRFYTVRAFGILVGSHRRHNLDKLPCLVRDRWGLGLEGCPRFREVQSNTSLLPPSSRPTTPHLEP